MVSVQRGNDHRLNAVVGVPHTQLQYSLTVESNLDWVNSISGPAHPVYNKAPDVTLELTYYVDQMAMVEQKDLLPLIDEKLAVFLRTIDGAFIQRVIEPYRHQHAVTIYYKVKLFNIENYELKLEEAARHIYDAQFTKALEAKLSED